MEKNLQDGECLLAYGYTPFHQSHFDEFVRRVGVDDSDLQPARVLFTSRDHLRVLTAHGERAASLAGLFRRGDVDPPAVGDFVAVDVAQSGAGPSGGVVVRSALPRRTCISRKVAGEVTREQVVAANVDTIFLVMGLDGDYNLRRLERFAVLARESGAQPVVVLSKADLCEDAVGPRLDAQQAAPGMPVFAISSLTDTGLEALDGFLGPGQTVALVGSSGAGKSTLINRLAGHPVMKTGAVRAGDDRGRHTTTHRQLVPLPAGGLLLDNPGIRELQLWAGEEALESAFGDIESLARGCRFSDCSHDGEPGCAVQGAVDGGRLDAARLANWHGLSRELASLERRRNVAHRRREERRTSKLYRRVQSAKRSRRGSG
ncbi:MAG: ribosome small subunit-dependent GTPase A [Acidobacteriota bacterium]